MKTLELNDEECTDLFSILVFFLNNYEASEALKKSAKNLKKRILQEPLFV